MLLVVLELGAVLSSLLVAVVGMVTVISSWDSSITPVSICYIINAEDQSYLAYKYYYCLHESSSDFVN